MKLWKRIAAFAAAAALILMLPAGMTASAERAFKNCIQNVGLYDEDGVFDETVSKALDAVIKEASQSVNMYVAVCIRPETDPHYPDSQIETMADDMYDELFNPEPGTDTDGLLLYLNLSTRYAYITTSGLGQMYFYNAVENNRISQMIDNMTSYLRTEDYSGAIQRFCNDVKSYYRKGIPFGAYTKNSDTGKYLYVKDGKVVSGDKLPFLYGKNLRPYLIVGGIAGALTALIAYLIIKSRYKLKKSLEPTNYVSQKETQFLVHDDVFLRTHTSKTRIDTDSRSGGGGGGGFSHSSGGGHSHGGGGGHW